MLIYKRILAYLRNTVIFMEWEIFSLNSIQVVMLIIFDWMRIRFGGFVLIISSIVIFYLTRYIAGDLNFVRFTWIVYLFVLSIILLIISPNMIRILLGWDGLGLVSYCLVIYYQNVKSANAGILTILINRVGDVAILLRISWIFNYGGWNFYYLPIIFRENELLIIEVLVVLAAITKRAQVPFSAWLPAAMAAPTPVSSLVHSSTLVTAGVYLLIRFRGLIGVRFLLLLISVFTILVSGINANLEIDLKKVIALSTLSQLGVIIITISVGLIEIAFFHILSHALFKSLLFLCAGVFIHGMGDIQDIRDLGGLRGLSPVTSLYFLVCSLSLCGFPFIAGFYSKDILVEMYIIRGGLNFLILILIILRILLTSLYSSKLIYILIVKPLGLKKINNLAEDYLMIYPIRLLFYLAITGGSMMFWWFAPPLLIFLNIWTKLLILILIFILSSIVLAFINLGGLKKKILGWVVKFLGGISYLPYLSTFLFIDSLIIGKFIIKSLDHGWLEYAGGQGFINYLKILSLNVDKWNFLWLKIYLTLFFLIILLALSF